MTKKELVYEIYRLDDDLWHVKTLPPYPISGIFSKYAMRFLVKYAKQNKIKWQVSPRAAITK